MPTRNAIVNLAVLSLLTMAATPAFSAPNKTSPATGEPHEKRRLNEERQAATKLALEAVVAEFRVDGPLEQVFADYAAAAKVTLKPDWATLEAAGIKRKDTRVKLNVLNVKASKVLHLVLIEAAKQVKPADPAAAKGDAVKPLEMTYHVDDEGNVVPTTPAGFIEANTVEREYDIADLIRITKPNPTQAEEKKLAADIVKFIEETVAPDSWVSAKGKPGKIKFVAGGKLKVTQLKDNHAVIRKLFISMRDAAHLRQPPDVGGDGL